MIFAVIGAGNGGQAFAGHLASMGYQVRLYDRDIPKIKELNNQKRITLSGALNVEGTIEFASANLQKVISGTDIIMVATTATAHRPIAAQLAPLLEENQIILLNPGRTCGALEFKNTLLEAGLSKRVYIAEAQTLVYACRLIENGRVNIIGVKDRVLLSAFPASDTEHVLKELKPIFP
ncbi:MAG: NAD(P)-binding domain-containing protein [Allobaculum sp.]|nr:NAD(P)-binding domain-containing protein [Allobaculum sp.]